jgi:hypothetical protein
VAAAVLFAAQPVADAVPRTGVAVAAAAAVAPPVVVGARSAVGGGAVAGARAGARGRVASRASHPARRRARRRPLVSAGSIAAARRWARGRAGVVAFAALDAHGRLRGLRRTAAFPSASVVKAMLLVAALRRAGRHAIPLAEQTTLRHMITFSDNGAASYVYRLLGPGALAAVARAAGMRRFRDVGDWAGSQITAADQARLFLRVDGLVPRAHRGFALTLLSSIIPGQRWGIATVARRRGLRAFFKGGWRSGLEHQAALLERSDGQRVALAILTLDQPSAAYGRETEEGIAQRVLLR